MSNETRQIALATALLTLTPPKDTYFNLYKRDPVIGDGEMLFAYLKDKNDMFSDGAIYIGDGKHKFSELEPFIGDKFSWFKKRKIDKELKEYRAEKIKKESTKQPEIPLKERIDEALSDDNYEDPR